MPGTHPAGGPTPGPGHAAPRSGETVARWPRRPAGASAEAARCRRCTFRSPRSRSSLRVLLLVLVGDQAVHRCDQLRPACAEVLEVPGPVGTQPVVAAG